jgi:serine/threonine-protein kinase RsbW
MARNSSIQEPAGSEGQSIPRSSLHIEGSADQAFADDLLEALEPFLASAAAATDQDRFLFTLAMSEVVTNIVQHGGDGATLRVEMDVRADELRARIWDTAAPAMIDWESIRLPDDDAESGRGLVLALSVLNELRHTRSPDGNTWLLRRRFSAQVPGDGSAEQ